MLELKPVCENCGKKLSVDSLDAMICSFECTFCADCVDNVLHNVCPNCGGGFEKRSVRPKEKLLKYPASMEQIIKPVDMQEFEKLIVRNRDIKPNER